jgi:hypothetical protein
MAPLNMTPALRLFVPGNFEDAFVYMGTLLAVTDDHEIVSTNYDRLVEDTIDSPNLDVLYKLFLLQNDWLSQDGTQELLRDRLVRRSVVRRLTSGDEWLGLPEEWDSRIEYENLLGQGTLLDLQIYNQRLFAGTTSGMVQADLFADSGEVEFSAPRKRTDARCLSMSIRYGAVAASCGSDGLLLSFDEFSELDYEAPGELVRAPVAASVRTSWLGYHLINYGSATQSQALRSGYSLPRGGRRTVVVTEVAADERLIAPERQDQEGLDFHFNAHSTFFSHYASGRYEVRRRRWASGRLGKVESRYEGEMSRPLSTHEVLGGFVAETYSDVYLINDDGASRLYSGEAIAVRTFPNSRRYRNLVLVVSENGLHVISPIGAEPLLSSDD